MSKRIFLALAIHNHQPVGNFDHIFEQAYQKAYLPFVEVLERHPGVRMAFHFSGPLRDWLAEHHPELLARVRAMVQRGQLEMLGGGYYEPILAVIPDRDKNGQLVKLSRAVRDDFGYEPTGMWLAERVWEPHLPQAIAEAGLSYTIVDDAHFEYVGYDEEDLFGYYVTEEQGFTLKILPTSKHLRYAIPWAPVEEVIAYLRSHATDEGTLVAIMGDDGEKFGLWPGTYEHCYERGWLERFFSALEENADWCLTVPPGEYAERFPALGRVYLPTASYEEMLEWALPAERAGEIVRLKHQLEEEGREDVLRYVRGGFWRNFLVKYPEINTMHKKMLLVSRKVWSMPDGEERETALDHLWHGQCNCPYWHGVFGGVFLFHIRSANYHHLLKAERLADSVRHEGSWVEWSRTDLDGDAAEELLLGSDCLNLYLDLPRGGSAFEWDWRARDYNLANTLSRRLEGYHRDLVEAAQRDEVEVVGLARPQEGEIETIHTTRVRAKEPDLHRRLFYDWYRRACFLDHFLHADTTLDNFYRAQYGEAGDFVNQPYEAEVTAGAEENRLVARLWRDGHVWVGREFCPLRVEKRFDVKGGREELDVTYTLYNPGPATVQSRFGVECNWGLLGGNGPGAYYDLPGREPFSLAAMGQAEDLSGFRMVVEWLDMGITLAWDRPATLWHFPIETISNSEAGFERVYQGSCTMPLWPIDLPAGGTWVLAIRVTLAGSSSGPR